MLLDPLAVTGLPADLRARHPAEPSRQTRPLPLLPRSHLGHHAAPGGPLPPRDRSLRTPRQQGKSAPCPSRSRNDVTLDTDRGKTKTSRVFAAVRAVSESLLLTLSRISRPCWRQPVNEVVHDRRWNPVQRVGRDCERGYDSLRAGQNHSASHKPGTNLVQTRRAPLSASHGNITWRGSGIDIRRQTAARHQTARKRYGRAYPGVEGSCAKRAGYRQLEQLLVATVRSARAETLPAASTASMPN
jgi:hypothetical protein